MGQARTVHIENVTRTQALVQQGKIADNVWTRFRGLMGVRELAAGDGMLIRPCTSVHCMFMRIPIDVLYVGKDDCVVGIDHALRPWRIGTIYRHVSYVVELPAGAAAASGTEPGDQLAVSN